MLQHVEPANLFSYLRWQSSILFDYFLWRHEMRWVTQGSETASVQVLLRLKICCYPAQCVVNTRHRQKSALQQNTPICWVGKLIFISALTERHISRLFPVETCHAMGDSGEWNGQLAGRSLCKHMHLFCTAKWMHECAAFFNWLRNLSRAQLQREARCCQASLILKLRRLDWGFVKWQKNTCL